MANSNVHLIVGAGVSAVAYVGFCRWANRRVTPLAVVGAAFVGAVVASVPDVLEPAMHPNHRGSFHSLAALAVLAYAGLNTPQNPRLTQDQKLGAILASLAYISHLLLDGLTPKSLPVI